MLVFIFGFWMNLQYITNLEQIGDDCNVEFVGDQYKDIKIEEVSCNEVARAINMTAIKEQM